MLSSSSIYSTVWLQAPPLNHTNVAAATMHLALSFLYTLNQSRCSLTQQISMYLFCDTLFGN